MSKIKEEAETRCELALMGKVVPVNSNDEVQFMTEYIYSAMGLEPDNLVNVVDNAICKYQKNEVKFIVVNKVMDMRCITYLLDSGISDKEDENYYPAPFEEDYGTKYPCAFSYVLNVDCDWCSEFGDVFFKKMSDGFYHRAS